LEKIKLGISACLLGQNVRYDGGHKLDRFLTGTLGKAVQYVPVCPEVECGLGVPRESMRLVGDPAAPRLVTTRTGRDLTEPMTRWARARVRELEKENLCGFIFKSRSPSCGLEISNRDHTKSTGIFARVFLEHFSLLPAEEGERLHDPLRRENFIERTAALRQGMEKSPSGESRKRSITRRLLTWYDGEKRDLPWRKTHRPYRIWIAEIMLQQTQVDTVVPFYRRFLKAFPTLKVLANASFDEVLKAWENLGYYSRARNLHAAARMMVEKFRGRFPRTRDEILSLPGIGPYTAAAILSIAFGAPVAAVDGNVRRVIARLFALTDPSDRPGTQKKIETLAASLIPPHRPGDFNQALMDLGATICMPKVPRCVRCPVRGLCMARSKGLQDRLPLRAPRNPLPQRDMAAAVITKGLRVLLVQRPRRGLLGGLWKFPGGMKEKGETLESSLIRNVRQEIGAGIQIEGKLAALKHAYSHFRVTLHAFRCRISDGRPRALGCPALTWARAAELPGFALSKADRDLIRLIFVSDSPADRG